MKSIAFNLHENVHINQKEIENYRKKIKNQLDQLSEAFQQPYQNPSDFIQLPFDEHLLESVQDIYQQKQKLNPAAIVLIGIGGSNLGTLAILEALFSKKGTAQFPLYCADTVDSDYIAYLLHEIETCFLKNDRSILIMLVSKSGTTTESIANFECFLQLLMKYYSRTYADYVIAITDKDSKLWNLAHEKKFTTVAIPKKIAGRYSVLSPVGLLPLLFCGVDIEQLRAGAQSITSLCLSNEENNPALTSAAILAASYKKENQAIHDFFIFDNALESVGKWHRQLLSESIGKISQKDNIPIGIMPTVTIGSTDLHSMAQLYFAKPDNRMTTFIWVSKPKKEVMVPHFADYDALVPSIQNRSLFQIMSAIYQGVQSAYAQKNLPFMSITLPEINEYYIGQLLQYFMIKIMLLGYMLEVNPFDQPQVELYKSQTRKILAHA